MSGSLVLDLAGITKDGANVQLWTSHDGGSQRGVQVEGAAEEVRDGVVPSVLEQSCACSGACTAIRTTGGTEMTEACGGWWKATQCPPRGSVKTGLSFSYGSATDDNGGKLYDVKGRVRGGASGS